MSEMTQELPISADLLEILRDPKAVQEPEKYGSDPGKLELAHGSWLVSEDTGYKYPIKDGIPVMLIEEGARWKDTPVEELPVPPETAVPPIGALQSADTFMPEGDGGGSPTIYFVLAGVLTLVSGLVIWKLLSRKKA